MNEKKTKNSWFSWAVIALVFLTVIFFLLLGFVKDGKGDATQGAYSRIIGFTSSWKVQLDDELTKGEEYGAILKDYAVDDSLDLSGREFVSHLAKFTKASKFNRILVCKGDKVLVDDQGMRNPAVDISTIIQGDEDVLVKRYLLENADGEGNGAFAISYPLDVDGAYLIFLLDPRDIMDNLEKHGYEDLSFLVIFRKDGTVVSVLDRYKDVESSFITGGNILTSIQEGTSPREVYNIFKGKLYNNSDCAVHSKFNGDSRTIACSSLSITGYYIGYGVRQYQVDTLVDSSFKNIQSTVVKLILVLTIFTLFIIGTVIFNSFKTKEKGKKLEDKADTDMLTELSNKAATERQIQEYIAQNPKGRGLLFILDIDNFKKVNDTMGHAFGDTLLRTLGKEIRAEFRVTDIVGRTGGDEFMIFLKDINDDLLVEREANRVTRFFHDFKAGGDYVKYSATASIGVAVFSEDGETFQELYEAADQALYRAKKRGKNQLVFYNEAKFSNKQ